jgi:protein involved in temperature-dependent protein secretion
MRETLQQAMDAGDYARAHAIFVQQPDAGTPGGIANAALLLAMSGQHDQAEQQLARTQAPAVEWIVRGDRARAVRWRDANAAGRLAVAQPMPTTPFYAGMAVALLTRDEKLVDRLHADFAKAFRPSRGRLVFRDGKAREFQDLRDSDDAIGQMFEVFAEGACVYFPYEMVQRIAFEEPQSFVTLYHPRCQIALRDGRVANGFAPLLYAGSMQAPSPYLRTGRETTFSYVGRARRALGQRDFVADGGAMIGMQHIAAIEFA